MTEVAGGMASLAQCRRALQELIDRLAEVDPELRRKHAVDRTLSCHIPDLDTTFYGTLTEHGLVDVTEEPRPEAQVRLTVDSDDLLALCRGELQFATAWARGRLRIDASVLDLLRLRTLI
ncbi:MAG: SCP2 sterol-binding domain-containing protein [Actinomycetes bacterium]